MKGPSRSNGRQGSDWLWSQYSRFYDSVYHLMPYRSLLWDSYQALELGPGMKLLDAGCGTGNFECFIAEKNAPPVEIEAVDFSPAMLEVAKKKCGALGNVNLACKDLNSDLPYSDATFDRIVSINVWYALEETDRTMREFLRVLKPGGILVLTSPAPHFKITALLVDHFRRVRNIWGALRKVRTLASSLLVLLTTGLGSALLNVLVINRREHQGRYESLGEAEMRTFLGRHSDPGQFQVVPAMANQNVLATVTRV